MTGQPAPGVMELVAWLRQQGRTLRDLQLDSRRVQAGDVFIAVRGRATDGRQYLDAALVEPDRRHFHRQRARARIRQAAHVFLQGDGIGGGQRGGIEHRARKAAAHGADHRAAHAAGT